MSITKNPFILSSDLRIQHIMAGAATDSSHMGITLQGYDQVIALSQANINETLRRYFASLDAKNELCNFEAKANTSSITAEVLAPTVELVDKDKKDSALYIVHLGEGTYSTAIEVDDGFEKVKTSTNGWELAFDIDFAFEPTLKIPENIVRQVPLPGGYSVQQLLINFGDVTRIRQLNPNRTKFPVSETFLDKVGLADVEAGLQLFLGSYLKQLIKKEDHNILGFAIKVNQAYKGAKPRFVPTDSKVQIIGHRTYSKAESFP